MTTIGGSARRLVGRTAMTAMLEASRAVSAVGVGVRGTGGRPFHGPSAASWRSGVAVRGMRAGSGRAATADGVVLGLAHRQEHLQGQLRGQLPERLLGRAHGHGHGHGHVQGRGRGQGRASGAAGRGRRHVSTGSVAGAAGGASAAEGGKGAGEAVGGVVTVPNARVRNFCIIAHIDHGKSTLADRLLEATNTVEVREMRAQYMDSLELEQERGITIKLNSVRMSHRSPADGETYCLNLIDTPGHVDFSYEVSRSLQACEGALLVVDAAQGIEAQTLANVYLALENNLEIIPVINKIDLPGAEPDRVMKQIEEVIGIDCAEAVLCSAKAGIGIDKVLEAIVAKVPAPPEGADVGRAARALIYDSYYDPYRGVVVQMRVKEGVIRSGDKVRFFASGKEYMADEVGVLAPGRVPRKELRAGEVGYLVGAIRSVKDARVGDTVTLAGSSAATEALPGYREPVPMVFCGLFPVESDQFPLLRESLEKLQLNDAALKFDPENSSAMGFGFRCGFLGLLHMDVVQERLEREYGLDLIVTAPSVVFKVNLTDGTQMDVDNPAMLPPGERRRSIEEPVVKLDLITPDEYIGPLMELAQQRRGTFKNMEYLAMGRTSLHYELPLCEMVTDFFDELKSRSKGYASMEYVLSGYKESKMVRLDIKINGDPVDALTCIVHEDFAYSIGKKLTDKLKEVIPRAQFKIPIQATIGNKSIASSVISAARKDVLAKCYGGDISRKKKLLKKQAAGKKRMKAMGKVNVPQEAFMAIVNIKAGDP